MDGRIATLDEPALTAVLEDLTAELRRLPALGTPVATEEEARAAIAALLDVSPETIVTEPDAESVARHVLANLAADPQVAEEAEELIADPPRDRQMGVDPTQILLVPVVLGAVISWLQTRVHIKVRRERPQGSVEVEIVKESTDPETLRQVASSLADMLRRAGD
jgi:hypothetical protein